MKCPKCGYHSFEHLESCRKCGIDLTEHKAKYNLRGFFFPGLAAASSLDMQDMDEAATVSAGADFGFDFLDNDEPATDDVTAAACEDPALADDLDLADGLDLNDDFATSTAERFSLDNDTDPLSIDQPFGIDVETVPADEPAQPDPKKGPGNEFSF